MSKHERKVGDLVLFEDEYWRIISADEFYKGWEDDPFEDPDDWIPTCGIKRLTFREPIQPQEDGEYLTEQYGIFEEELEDVENDMVALALAIHAEPKTDPREKGVGEKP